MHIHDIPKYNKEISCINNCITKQMYQSILEKKK